MLIRRLQTYTQRGYPQDLWLSVNAKPFSQHAPWWKFGFPAGGSPGVRLHPGVNNPNFQIISRYHNNVAMVEHRKSWEYIRNSGGTFAVFLVGVHCMKCRGQRPIFARTHLPQHGETLPYVGLRPLHLVLERRRQRGFLLVVQTYSSLKTSSLKPRDSPPMLNCEPYI